MADQIVANPLTQWPVIGDGHLCSLGRRGLHAARLVVAGAGWLTARMRRPPVPARPEDPLAVLWHAATRLREQRGDAHVVVLAASGISGHESNVLHAAAGSISRDCIGRTRDFEETSWRHYEPRRAERSAVTPMTLRRDELHDESAHLVGQ